MSWFELFYSLLLESVPCTTGHHVTVSPPYNHLFKFYHQDSVLVFYVDDHFSGTNIPDIISQCRLFIYEIIYLVNLFSSHPSYLWHSDVGVPYMWWTDCPVMQVNNTVCRNIIAAVPNWKQNPVKCLLGLILDFLYFSIDMFYLQAL
jgi:hypothetical protein